MRRALRHVAGAIARCRATSAGALITVDRFHIVQFSTGPETQSASSGAAAGPRPLHGAPARPSDASTHGLAVLRLTASQKCLICCHIAEGRQGHRQRPAECLRHWPSQVAVSGNVFFRAANPGSEKPDWFIHLRPDWRAATIP